MSGSNMDLDRCGQRGLGEGPVCSSRGLGSTGLPTASTDSLTADTSEQRLPFQTHWFPGPRFLSFTSLNQL